MGRNPTLVAGRRCSFGHHCRGAIATLAEVPDDVLERWISLRARLSNFAGTIVWPADELLPGPRFRESF